MAEHSKPTLTKEDEDAYLDKLMDILSESPNYSQIKKIRELIKEIWDDAQS